MTLRRSIVARPLFVVPIVAFAVVASACIPNMDGKRATVREVAAAPGATPGGRIRVATDIPAGIDPTAVQEPASRLIVGTICDQLVTLDPVTGEPRPGIAESWSIADRGRKVFLRLRRDVRFHSGRRLTAEDVRYSLTRLASAEEASAAAELVEPIAGYEFVHGDAETDDERFRRALVGVTVIDPQSLEITLRDSFADWFRVLSEPATSPVPREEVERDPVAFSRAPVCTGPYRVAAPVDPGGRVRVVRFEDYHGGSESYTRGGRGYADEIVFVPFRRRAAADRALRAGRVDVAYRPERSGPTPSRVAEHRVPTAQVEFIGLPTAIEPFDDPAVRVALSLALDRTAIAREVYGSGRLPATTFVPPAIVDAHRADACTASARPRAALDDARAALERARVDLSGRTVTLAYNPEFRNRELVEAVARAWRDAFGLRVEPTPMPWPRLLELGTRPRGIGGMFRYGWAPPYASVDAMLAPLFHVDGIGRDNLSLFGAREFNEAIRAGRRAVIDDERARELTRAEDVLCRQMPMIPVAVAARRIGISERFMTALADGTDPVHRVSAEPLLRELALRR